MIGAALSGSLENVRYETDPFFGLRMPSSCPGVPDAILNPRNAWVDKDLYDNRAKELCLAFVENFRQFEEFATEEMLAARPKLAENTI
jgi:phosphoenolpyruvate carboxykinase (ATP)